MGETFAVLIQPSYAGSPVTSWTLACVAKQSAGGRRDHGEPCKPRRATKCRRKGAELTFKPLGGSAHSLPP